MIQEKIIELLFVFPLFMLITRFAERKWSADAQTRVGPKLIGAKGLSQTAADFFKLISKKDYPWIGKKGAFLLIAICSCTSSLFLLTPTTEYSLLGEGAYSLLTVMSLFLFQLVLQVVLSWETKQDQTYFKITKSQAVFLPAAFALFLVIIATGIKAGSFSWTGIVKTQAGSFLNWGIFSFFPFGFVNMIVFCVSSMILFRVPPFFDYPITDVSGGIDSAISGLIQNIYFYFFSIFLTALFFGGWNLPLGVSSEQLSPALYELAQMLWVLTKSILISVSIKIILEPIARMDADQTLSLLWSYIAPAATLGLLGMGVYQWIVL